jgi:hypothetical protein
MWILLFFFGDKYSSLACSRPLWGRPDARSVLRKALILLPTQRKHQSPAEAAETPVTEPADAEETPVAESAATQRSHKPEDILPVNAKPVYAALDKLSNTIADHAKGVLYSRLK